MAPEYDYDFNNPGNNSCFVMINATHAYEISDCPYYNPCVPTTLNFTMTEYNKITGFKIFQLVVLILAVFGIMLTLFVLCRKHMCTSTNCYFISLAIADLGFLLLFATRWLETELDYILYDVYFRYAMIFLSTFLMASVWVTVMLAIERYIAICHSLRASSICTVKRAVIINILVFVFSFICRIPNFFEYSLKTAMSYDCTERTYIEPTPLGLNTTFRSTYQWINCILMTIVPFSALLYLNIRLIVEIRKSTHYLMDNIVHDSNLQNVLGREQRRVTLMLISIVIVFFMCQAPYVTYTVYSSIAGYHVRESSPIVLEFARALFMLKSVLNFILYCWFSEKFRDTFKKELCRKICRIFKRNRHVFSSRSHSDSLNSAQQRSLRKSSGQKQETVSTPMKEYKC